MSNKNRDAAELSRRRFLQTSSAAVAGLALTSTSPVFAHMSVDDTIRVGLVGCGGRGTGAAVNALTTEPRARLVALGDAFRDKVESSLKNLSKSEVSEQVAVDEEHLFSGFDAYKKVIESCDVVAFATPPHFRPQHLRAAVDAGKHVFCEKPVAVDAPGVRAVMETCELAAQKNLTVVSGLCYRYQDSKQELIQRVKDGAVGDIINLQCTYNASGLWHRGRKPEWSDMEWQLRNWLYFTWLSGDHIVEQSVHSIDKILWAMGDEAPEKCTASGGRIVRTEEKYGNIYDHFNTVFEWKNGVKGFHSCRQWQGAHTNVSDFVFGTRGTAAIQNHWVKGDTEWRFRGQPCDMYESEWRALFKAVKENQPRNDGDYMCKATLMAIMARMSAYTGKRITWEQALNSQEDLTPGIYAWGPLEVAPIAQPGQTPFV